MATTYVICHGHPGDLMTTRPLLHRLALAGRTVCIVRRHVAALIADLPVQLCPYEAASPRIVGEDRWASMIGKIPMTAQDTLVDLVGTQPVMDWVALQPARKLGLRFEADEVLPYDRAAPWHAGPQDRAHVSLRYLRLLPSSQPAQDWTSDLFEPGLFRDELPGGAQAIANRVALCPGSGRGGENKRMPDEFWSRLTRSLRERGQELVWFIGPDEEAMATLAESGDTIEAGDGESVKAAHRSCAMAVTTDTCHMHIRAFLQRHGIALFRRDDFYAWGGYPGFISGVEPPVTNAVQASLDAVLGLFDAHDPQAAAAA
jgi:ADP-heptose:LPS heptosyltransferase